MFRRFRARKQQLERVKRRNQKMLQMAQDEMMSEAKDTLRAKATLKIQRAWRRRQTSKIKTLNFELATSFAKSFGRVEVVQIEGIKRCVLCKKETAVRQFKSEVRNHL
jgi:hypothetical protein